MPDSPTAFRPAQWITHEIFPLCSWKTFSRAALSLRSTSYLQDRSVLANGRKSARGGREVLGSQSPREEKPHTCSIFLPVISEVRSRLFGQELLKLSTMMTWTVQTQSESVTLYSPRWAAEAWAGGGVAQHHPARLKGAGMPKAADAHPPHIRPRGERLCSVSRCIQPRPSRARCP